MKKKIIAIGVVLIFFTVAISGCIDNKIYTTNEEELLGIIEDVEIIDNNLILYFKKENYSVRPMIFRDGYSLYDYAYCKQSIGDKVWLFYIEHITTDDDRGLYEFWLEFQAIEDYYGP